jgi:hypothetical protein
LRQRPNPILATASEVPLTHEIGTLAIDLFFLQSQELVAVDGSGEKVEDASE